MKASAIKQRIKFSALGRWAALPQRLLTAGAPLALQAARAAVWMVRSKEWANFTYNYQPLGLDAVVAAISVLTGQPTARLHQFADELKSDRVFRKRFDSKVSHGPMRFVCDQELRFGRCLVNYLLVRATQPRHVFEAGTEHGLSTWAMCRALQANRASGGPQGTITTVDLTPDRGGLLEDDEQGLVRRLTGDSIACLSQPLEPIDLFLHDTTNDPHHTRAQLAALRPHLAPAALIHSCWFSEEFVRFCEDHGLTYLEYVERVENHWYPGRRCGVARLNSTPPRSSTG